MIIFNRKTKVRKKSLQKKIRQNIRWIVDFSLHIINLPLLKIKNNFYRNQLDFQALKKGSLYLKILALTLQL